MSQKIFLQKDFIKHTVMKKICFKIIANIYKITVSRFKIMIFLEYWQIVIHR